MQANNESNRDREHQSIARRFAAAAPTYDQYGAIQNTVAAHLANILPEMPGAGTILEVGCGTGLFTRRLVRHYPKIPVQALDIAAGMLEHAQANLADQPQVKGRVADICTTDLAADHALIASSCALQWVHPLAPVLKQLADALRPGGCLCAAVLVRGTLAEVHIARRAVAPHKPLPRELITADELRRDLAATGLTVEAWEEQALEIALPTGWAVLQMLHAQGLTAGPLSGGTQRLNAGELQALTDYYDTHFRAGGGGVRVTYQVALFRARRTNRP